MFKKLTYLFIASLLILSSCGKQDTVVAETINHHTSNEIYSPKQEILFHYGFENQATGELKGWLIDKNGVIRTYDFTNATDVPELPSPVNVPDELMENLYNYSTATNIQIDLEVLEENYKKISETALGRIDDLQGGTAGEGTTSISAYHYVAICDDYNPTHHQMITLETFGAINQINARQETVGLVEWIKEIKVNENL